MFRDIIWLSRCKGIREGGICVDIDSGILGWYFRCYLIENLFVISKVCDRRVVLRVFWV